VRVESRIDFKAIFFVGETSRTQPRNIDLDITETSDCIQRRQRETECIVDHEEGNKSACIAFVPQLYFRGLGQTKNLMAAVKFAKFGRYRIDK
jgi:7,8-dihydro-6-hydroxymethylpterin-pyrophosphokinase